jgi:hypothetical protein
VPLLLLLMVAPGLCCDTLSEVAYAAGADVDLASAAALAMVPCLDAPMLCCWLTSLSVEDLRFMLRRALRPVSWPDTSSDRAALRTATTCVCDQESGQVSWLPGSSGCNHAGSGGRRQQAQLVQVPPTWLSPGVHVSQPCTSCHSVSNSPKGASVVTASSVCPASTTSQHIVKAWNFK